MRLDDGKPKASKSHTASSMSYTGLSFDYYMFNRLCRIFGDLDYEATQDYIPSMINTYIFLSDMI